MLITISPYDLTARAPSAMVGLLLADEAATLVPAPIDPREAFGADPEQPGDLRHLGALMVKWLWSAPLWRAGVLSPGLGGNALLGEVERVRESIMRSPEGSALRRIVERFDRAGDAPSFYDAISRDILRSGTEPGVSVPISVALERFAGATGSFLARGQAVSITERIEERDVRPLMGVAIPCVLGASGEGLVVIRGLLEEALDRLRDAIDAAVQMILAGVEMPGLEAEQRESVEPAARTLHEAFRSERPAIMEAEGDDCRPMMVMLTIGLQPGGTAMRSAVRAAESVMARRPTKRAAGRAALMESAPGAETTLSEAPCLTMSVRTLPWDV